MTPSPAAHWLSVPLECSIAPSVSLPWPGPVAVSQLGGTRWQEQCSGLGMGRRQGKSVRWGVCISPCPDILSSQLCCAGLFGAGPSLTIYARKWWEKKEESRLKKDSALPLPLAYPSPKPLSKEEVDKLVNCNAEVQECKNVVYQWTGKCKSCQGTGTVSFHRKRGREVNSSCIACLGLGFVQRITSRDDIKVMDEAEPES